MDNSEKERKARLLALKKRVANDEAAKKIRQAAAKNIQYRASFSREAFEKFIDSRPYFTLLGKGLDSDEN